MELIRLNCKTPKRVDPRIRQLLLCLGLNEANATWLDFHRPKRFVPEQKECHINAWIQTKYEGGSTCTGWTIWQDRSADFVEAQFHTVWRDASRLLRDVTPRQHKEKKVLFLPDPLRSIKLTDYNGLPAIKTFDNVRMQDGELRNGIREQVHVLVTELIYVHGLAERKHAEP